MIERTVTGTRRKMSKGGSEGAVFHQQHCPVASVRTAEREEPLTSARRAVILLRCRSDTEVIRRGVSSAGRAQRWQRWGHGFESRTLHHLFCVRTFSGSLPGRWFISDLPTYTCQRSASRIRIDGVMDEAGWSAAEPISLVLTGSGAPPRQPTTAKLLWDDEYLYAGFDCIGRT